MTRYLLNAFGGAGGQHACLVADALGMERVLIHPLSGLLSAYGIGLARVTEARQQGLEVTLDARTLTRVSRRRSTGWRARSRRRCDAQGVAATATCSLTGACTCAMPAPTPRCRCSGTAMRPRRARRSRRRIEAEFGFADPDAALVIESAEIEGQADERRRRPRAGRRPAEGAPRPKRSDVPVFSGGEWHDAAVVRREALDAGHATSPAPRW